MLKGIVIAFFSFILFLSHIFIFHNFEIRRRFFAMFKIFLCGLLAYIVLFVLISEGLIENLVESFIPLSLLAFLNGAFLHFFFFYFYLHLIQIIDRSPSTRIMVEIERSPEKKLTLEEIKRSYSIDGKISCELEDMVILGRLKKESNLYTITPGGGKHMRIFKFIRDYLGLNRN